MHKNLKYSLIFAVLAFADLWLGCYLIEISGLGKSDIMIFPAILTTMFSFIALLIASFVNFLEYGQK